MDLDVSSLRRSTFIFLIKIIDIYPFNYFLKGTQEMVDQGITSQ